MGVRRFGQILGWCCFATLLVALGLIVADRFYPLGAITFQWAQQQWGLPVAVAAPLGWATGGLVLGLLLAIVWMYATRRDPLATAIEFDGRFGLKERVSSTLAMSAEESTSEAGRALIDDAVRRVGRVEVSGKFSMSPGRPMLLPLIPAVLAVLVAWFAAQATPTIEEADKEANKAASTSKHVKKLGSDLGKELAKRR
ncbi:MAG: hypothetical protein GY953_48165, partial [bacterium]|nr:hypothetical protein [bacterium]